MVYEYELSSYLNVSQLKSCSLLFFSGVFEVVDLPQESSSEDENFKNTPFHQGLGHQGGGRPRKFRRGRDCTKYVLNADGTWMAPLNRVKKLKKKAWNESWDKDEGEFADLRRSEQSEVLTSAEVNQQQQSEGALMKRHRHRQQMIHSYDSDEESEAVQAW